MLSICNSGFNCILGRFSKTEPAPAVFINSPGFASVTFMPCVTCFKTLGSSCPDSPCETVQSPLPSIHMDKPTIQSKLVVPKSLGTFFTSLSTKSFRIPFQQYGKIKGSGFYFQQCRCPSPVLPQLGSAEVSYALSTKTHVFRAFKTNCFFYNNPYSGA